MVSEHTPDERIWTFPASELEPGDMLLCSYDKRLVLEVIPIVDPFSRIGPDDPNRILRCLVFPNQTERKDSYCFLWDHQVIRNGEIIYDANNPPPDPG